MREVSLMKQINIWSYLKLDSFGVETPFSKSRTEFISFFHENNIPIDTPTEMHILVMSKLFSLDIDFFVSFQFRGEKLIAVTMSPNTTSEDKTLDCRYNKIQKTLENELGYPHNRMRSIMNLLDPDNRFSYWHRDGIKIEHYLLIGLEWKKSSALNWMHNLKYTMPTISYQLFQQIFLGKYPFFN